MYIGKKDATDASVIDSESEDSYYEQHDDDTFSMHVRFLLPVLVRLIYTVHIQDTCSTEDLDDEGELLDELFLLEVQSRRERDFGRSASNGSSWTDRGEENGYECDSLCTESEISGDLKHSGRVSCDLGEATIHAAEKELFDFSSCLETG